MSRSPPPPPLHACDTQWDRHTVVTKSAHHLGLDVWLLEASRTPSSYCLNLQALPHWCHLKCSQSSCSSPTSPKLSTPPTGQTRTQTFWELSWYSIGLPAPQPDGAACCRSHSTVFPGPELLHLFLWLQSEGLSHRTTAFGSLGSGKTGEKKPLVFID